MFPDESGIAFSWLHPEATKSINQVNLVGARRKSRLGGIILSKMFWYLLPNNYKLLSILEK